MSILIGSSHGSVCSHSSLLFLFLILLVLIGNKMLQSAQKGSQNISYSLQPFVYASIQRERPGLLKSRLKIPGCTGRDYKEIFTAAQLCPSLFRMFWPKMRSRKKGTRRMMLMRENTSQAYWNPMSSARGRLNTSQHSIHHAVRCRSTHA